jgi:rSAM/selenodomain-associated transferase 2
MIRISIVIPALNEAANIAAGVQHAWACRPHEVLVVDGGSRDDTGAIAQAAGGMVFSSPPGRGCQQNYGARQATGDVLLFLHADNWLAADGCRQIEDALQGTEVVCGAFLQSIQAAGRRYRLLESGNAWRARWLGLPYGDQGIFIRRHTFEQLGGFPDVPLMEDWLLMRRLRRVSRPVLLPGPIMVSARRWQRHGVARQTLRNWSLVAAATAGVSPHTLARFYAPHSQLSSELQPEQRHAG